MRVALVGVGNLGRALAESLVASGEVSPAHLLLVERDTLICQDFGDRLGCGVVAIDALAGVPPFDVVLIAVKPQDAKLVCSALAPSLTSGTSVVSVMAGVPIASLATYLGGHQKIARAMPNLGAAIRESVTVYVANEAFIPAELEAIERILSSIGKTWRVDAESLVDAATAVSGSGPAYVCWFAEQLEHAAQELGFSAEHSRAMVLQTLLGTTQYLAKSGLTFKKLREHVTSPNGTTAAALGVLDGSDVGIKVQQAVKGAFERARELAKSS